jgi:hypothetical protein
MVRGAGRECHPPIAMPARVPDGELGNLFRSASVVFGIQLDRRRREREADAGANTSKRVMGCVSSGSPNSLRRLRKAARLGDWLVRAVPGAGVVVVNTPA